MLAEGTTLAAAYAAGDVNLAGGLGEREEVRTVARGAILAEHAFDEVVERALEVAEGDAAVDDQSLDLVELRQVAGVCRIGTVDATGSDHVDGRLLVLHGVDLDAGGLRAQQHIGLAMSVLLGMGGGTGRVILDVERIARRAARVVERRVERGEVIPAGLDLRAGLDGVADAAEYVLDLLDDLVDQVLMAQVRTNAGQGDVHGLGCHELADGGALELLHAALEQRLRHTAHLVGALTQHRTLLGRDLAHHAHQAGDLALAAQQGHARRLELLARLSAFDQLLRARFQLFELVDQTHSIPLSVVVLPAC